jgi:hypothetical protein
MGCILGELLTLTPRYQKVREKKEANGIVEHYLFEGDSCYPISPMNQEDVVEQDQQDDGEAEDGKTAFSSNDQIAKILSKLGTLSKKDKSFIDN